MAEPVRKRLGAEHLLAPSLARLETQDHECCLVGALSHQGAGHAGEGMPNQDAFCIVRAGGATVIAVADGVSSKPLSHVGANFAVQSVAVYLRERLLDGVVPTTKLLAAAYDATRKRLASYALSEKQPLDAYACTLLVAVIGGRCVTVGKIGDGAVVAVESQRDATALVSLVDVAHVGEGVVDLTHSDWKPHLRLRHIDDLAVHGISAVALATDGACPYFIKAGGPARPTLSGHYIGPEFAKQLQARGPRNMVGYFASLMFAKQHVDESDDKTLVVAALKQGARR